ncbi:MAG TPA: DUF3293 domain-containing protein [Burkholderiales bacterium]|nr:DUF3293 domain-containing protein [Burkholderiales bacterium]
MKAELLRAYLDTAYRVFFREETVDIRIGRTHGRLDELLEGRSWAFVSACNPGSVQCTDNARRHALLTARLKDHRFHAGMGVPDRGDWPPEESVLICGIEEDEAVLIGREFGQNAIVCGENGSPARLVPISGEAF